MENLYEKYLSCSGRVITDSRRIEPGCMFFALKGENFDGNEYALKALEAGASYAVVNQTWYESASVSDNRLIPVPDTLVTLRELAAWHRDHTFVNGDRLTVLALTGTNGKTTTKELIRAVLSKKFKVTATEGNLNNNIGVPLTLLTINPSTEIAVVEMGASHPGDIDELVDIAHPDYGLITNVGRAHLLGFGSFEGVKNTKGELYDYIRDNGHQVFVNVDNPDLCQMAQSREMDFIPYGCEFQDAVILPSGASKPFLSIDIPSVEDDSMLQVRTSLVGAYNADNVLAAISVGRYFGIPEADIVDAINSYVPSNNRSQMVRTCRNTLIVDAYNANPTSMAAALDNFRQMEAPLKIALLGDMRELGAESLAEHSKIASTALSSGIDKVYFVGDEFGKVLPSGCTHFKTSEELAAFLKDNAPEDALVLVKGSRGIRMETVLPVL